MGIFPTGDAEYDAIYAEEAAAIEASEAIAVALEASGISRADLARRLDVSRAEITSRLRGERNITVQTLAATLHALGHTLEIRAVAPDPQPATVVEDQTYLRWDRSAHEADRSEKRAERLASAREVVISR